jgi:hypothetical protein
MTNILHFPIVVFLPVVLAGPMGDRWPKGHKGEPPARVDYIVIIDKGIYRADLKEVVLDPQSPSGTRERIDNIALEQDTTTIPRSKNTRFGFRYSIVGAPSGGQVALKMVAIYPGGRRGEFALVQSIGPGPYYWGLRLDENGSLGQYRFQAWADQRLLTELVFNVVQP